MFGKSISPDALIKKGSKAQNIITEVEKMLKEIEYKEKTATEIITDFGAQVEEELVRREDGPLGPKLKIDIKRKADECINLNAKDITSQKTKLDNMISGLNYVSRAIDRSKIMLELIHEIKKSHDIIETISETELQNNIKKIKNIMIDAGIMPANSELMLDINEQQQVRNLVRIDPQNHAERKLFINQAYTTIIMVYLGLYAKHTLN